MTDHDDLILRLREHAGEIRACRNGESLAGLHEPDPEDLEQAADALEAQAAWIAALSKPPIEDAYKLACELEGLGQDQPTGKAEDVCDRARLLLVSQAIALEAASRNEMRYLWLRLSKDNPAYKARSAEYPMQIYAERLDNYIDAEIEAQTCT